MSLSIPVSVSMCRKCYEYVNRASFFIKTLLESVLASFLLSLERAASYEALYSCLNLCFAITSVMARFPLWARHTAFRYPSHHMFLSSARKCTLVVRRAFISLGSACCSIVLATSHRWGFSVFTSGITALNFRERLPVCGSLLSQLFCFFHT